MWVFYIYGARTPCPSISNRFMTFDSESCFHEFVDIFFLFFPPCIFFLNCLLILGLLSSISNFVSNSKIFAIVYVIFFLILWNVLSTLYSKLPLYVILVFEILLSNRFLLVLRTSLSQCF